jgi:hypothetical protein
MKKTWFHKVQAVVLFVLFSVLLAACSAGLNESPEELQLEATATATTYTGRATAVRLNVLGIRRVFANAGPLPSGGGADEATLIRARVPGTLSTGILSASTVGQGNRTFSDASTDNLIVNVAGTTIRGDFIQAEAAARCPTGTNTTPILNGNSQIVGLVVGGNTVRVTGAPNQRVRLPGGLGQIIINEQIRTRNGNTGSITVNALRVVVGGVTQVVVSSAQAGITCTDAGQPGGPGGPGEPGVGELVRGFGRILCDGRCVSFSIMGGRNDEGSLWGKGLMLTDPTRGLTVNGQSVTGYRVVDANTRVITGTATVNGRSGFTYRVTIDDNGPGTQDVIRIEVFNPQGQRIFFCVERLDCGNLRILNPNPNRVAPPGRERPPCNCDG